MTFIATPGVAKHTFVCDDDGHYGSNTYSASAGIGDTRSPHTLVTTT